MHGGQGSRTPQCEALVACLTGSWHGLCAAGPADFVRFAMTITIAIVLGLVYLNEVPPPSSSSSAP